MRYFSAYEKLLNILGLVASESSIQIAALPPQVCIADEIALLYDDVYRQGNQLRQDKFISEKVLCLMTKLQNHFDDMSNNKELWDLKALRFSYEWQKSRIMAQEIINLLA